MYLRILIATFITAALAFGSISSYAADTTSAQEKAKQEAKTKKESIKVESKKEATSKTSKISLNSASKEQLKEIKGVGDVLADAIIKGRPYKSWDDVSKVKGIGDAKLKAIKEKATL